MLKLGKTTFLQVFRTTQNMFLHQETSILLFFNEIIKYGAGGGVYQQNGSPFVVLGVQMQFVVVPWCLMIMYVKFHHIITQIEGARVFCSVRCTLFFVIFPLWVGP